MTPMLRNLPLFPISTCLYLVLMDPLLAAQAASMDMANPPPTESDMAAAKSADVCRDDLKTFSHQMETDGYWIAGEGYSLGYPMGAAGFGMYGGTHSESGVQARPAFAGPGFANGRPGYEVRILMASANILARHGQQQPCEDVLSSIRGLYQRYVSDLQQEGAPPLDAPGWRQREIAAAVPVIGLNVAFRSDELLGVEVRSPEGVALGSVDDLALIPETGKLAYLVIARGGVFGASETRIPIPWGDFKAAPNATLLVLDATKGVLDAAPQVTKNTFTIGGNVDSDSEKVDAYWRVHQPPKAVN